MKQKQKSDFKDEKDVTSRKKSVSKALSGGIVEVFNEDTSAKCFDLNKENESVQSAESSTEMAIETTNQEFVKFDSIEDINVNSITNSDKINDIANSEGKVLIVKEDIDGSVAISEGIRDTHVDKVSEDTYNEKSEAVDPKNGEVGNTVSDLERFNNEISGQKTEQKEKEEEKDKKSENTRTKNKRQKNIRYNTDFSDEEEEEFNKNLRKQKKKQADGYSKNNVVCSKYQDSDLSGTTVVTRDMPEERKVANGMVRLSDTWCANYKSGMQWNANQAPKMMIDNDKLVEELDVDNLDEALDQLEYMKDEDIRDMDSAFYKSKGRDEYDPDESDWARYISVMREDYNPEGYTRKNKPYADRKLNHMQDGYNTPHTEGLYLSRLTSGESIDLDDFEFEKKHIIMNDSELVDIDEEMAQEIIDAWEDGDDLDEIAEILDDSNVQQQERYIRKMKPYLVTMDKMWENDRDYTFDDLDELPVLGVGCSVSRHSKWRCGKESCTKCPHGVYARIVFRDENNDPTTRYAGKTVSGAGWENDYV